MSAKGKERQYKMYVWGDMVLFYVEGLGTLLLDT